MADDFDLLLVEDNPGDARLIHEYLRTSNGRSFAVTTVCCLAAAKEYVDQHAPDMILLDLNLPDSSGDATFLQMKSSAPEVPVVILSGLDDVEQAKRLVERGAQDYLLKDSVNQTSLGRALLYAAERQRLLGRLRKADRARDMLRQCQHALIRAGSQQQLLDDICRIAVEGGGYRLAWVGLAQAEAARALTPVAHHGFEQGYLETVESIGWDVNEREPGPASKAIQTGATQIVHDIAVDPFFAPWRAEALQRGYAAMIALPLLSEGTCFGVLALYTERANALVEEEVGLLHELAEDLAYGWTMRRLRTEKEQGERRYRALIENSLDLVLILAADARITFVNPTVERMLGYVPATLIGTNAFSYLHPADTAAVRDLFARTAEKTGEVQTLAFRLRHTNGTWRTVDAVGSNLLDNEAVAGIVINARDVTEQREREEHLQTQERLATVGQLAAGIAHDFNNIMATVTLYSEALLRAPDHPRRTRYLHTIGEQARHASTLISQILDFSRRSHMERKPLDLQPFVKEVVKLLQRTLPASIAVEMEMSGEVQVVLGDPTRLQQVLMNLAVNARDAMPSGGQFRLGLRTLTVTREEEAPLPEVTPGRWVLLTASDTGSGIDPQVLPHLFEPFFTTKEKGKGTGLGLAQVYGIVKQHEGTITVSTEVGRGTTFTIYLPAAQLDVQAHDTPLFTADEALSAGNGEETILLVEDDQPTRAAMADVLAEMNYRVLEAADGIEALRQFERHQNEVTVVISDMVMPRMDGATLWQRLRALNAPVKMILITGYPLEQSGKSILGDNDLIWLQKPFTVEQILNAVQKAVAR